MDKVKAKAKAWEAEFQRTCQPKKAVCIGCVWLGSGEKKREGEEGEEGGGGGEKKDDVTFLARFSALVFSETVPVRIVPITTTTASLPDTQGWSRPKWIRGGA